MKNGTTDLQHIPGLATGLTTFYIEKKLLGQGNFYMKQNPEDQLLSIHEMQDMLNSGDYSHVMKKLMHYAKNVTGTNAYWNQVKEQLKATITQVGPPTIFWTLSCAEFHWPEFHALFSDSNIYNVS